jgi:hypothetical protein
MMGFRLPGQIMKLNFEQKNDASLETVWAAFNNSSNKERWQQNFESYKHRTGDPGQPGAISELEFNENGKIMTVNETITECREPVFLSASYESKDASTIIVNHFESQVLRQCDNHGFRATRMLQDKAQSAGNGQSFSRAATPYWSVRVAPFGRVVKRSSAVLRLLARTRH